MMMVHNVSATAFLSTLSLRRATGYRDALERIRNISIHALLAESDALKRCSISAILLFLSTLSLRRATVVGSSMRFFACSFLSTLSLRRATLAFSRNSPLTKYFYPRSPCGERLASLVGVQNPYHFYPRSPCGERQICHKYNIERPHFYPRSPCGERRRPGLCLQEHCRAFLSTLSLRRATSGPH